MEVNFIEF